MIKKFSVDKIQIACWLNPRDFGGQQNSLVFIHGSGGEHSCWSYQYSRFYKQFNIVAVDLPGHGASSGGGENDVDQYCLWIKKLLDVLRLPRPVLIGHSLGAAIVLKFALRYPQDIAGIVPVGGGIKMPVDPELLSGLKTNPALVIDRICKFSLACENRPRLFDPLQKSLSKVNTEIIYGDLSASNRLDLTDAIDKINTPVLALCGMEDEITPADLSRAIAARINGANLFLIAGAGHMVMLEKPPEFNRAVAEFAAGVCGT